MIKGSNFALAFTLCLLASTNLYAKNKDLDCHALIKKANGESPQKFKSSTLLKIEDSYLWDNWIIKDKNSGMYFRYSLSAPRTLGDPALRHLNARMRVFSSKDGNRWTDHGLIDDRLRWSGQTIQKDDGTFILLSTGVRPQETGDVHQSVEISYSEDGINFSKPHPFFDPYIDVKLRSKLEDMGYFLGPVGDRVSAFRDPHFYDGTVYLASRAIGENAKPELAVMRIKLDDNGYKVLSPIRLELESHIDELEVPNITKLSNGKYVLSVNLKSSAGVGNPSQADTWIRLYTADSPEGPWEPARGPSLDERGNLFTPEDRIFGFNFVQGLEPGQIYGSGFLRSGSNNDHTLTPVIKIELDE